MHTEFPFVLPCGYLAPDGVVHRQGVMRLATARDEIEPQRDAQVRQNRAYLTVLLLARVVTRLGNLDAVTPTVVEGLFAADFEHLVRLYEQLNGEEPVGVLECPSCAHEFEVSLAAVQDRRLGK